MDLAKIQQMVMNLATAHADDMEGAEWEGFLKAEARMCECLDILEASGIEFNPMTGETKPKPKNEKGQTESSPR